MTFQTRPRIRFTTAPGAGLRHHHSGHRGLFYLDDIDDATFWRLVNRSCELFRDPSAHTSPLAGKVVGILFTKTSTRTRTSFSTAVQRLGGQIITYGPNDLQLATGESISDTGRILGGMLDGLVARTAGPTAHLHELSRQGGGLPIVNAMSAEEHPTQAICDVATLALCSGESLDGLRLLYVGEGNNTATALAAALSRIPGSRTVFATPHGYAVPESYIEEAARRGAILGATVSQVHDPADLADDFDVVYTTRWQTTGTSKPDPDWREAFRPFYVDTEYLYRWPYAAFMHDLPAHRGEEIAGSVLDGPRSLAWTQGRMKFASAMAVMEWVLTTHGASGAHADS